MREWLESRGNSCTAAACIPAAASCCLQLLPFCILFRGKGNLTGLATELQM